MTKEFIKGTHLIQKNRIQDGDKVKINIERIKNYTYYNNLTKLYQNFVENNIETVFTAKVYDNNFIELQEQPNPRYLFYFKDLIKISTIHSDKE